MSTGEHFILDTDYFGVKYGELNLKFRSMCGDDAKNIISILCQLVYYGILTFITAIALVVAIYAGILYPGKEHNIVNIFCTPLTIILLGLLPSFRSMKAMQSFIDYIQARQRFGNLLKHNTLLDGQIESITGKEQGPNEPFYVTAVYKFQNPDGQWLAGKQVKRRETLKGKQLPSPGTRVYVLYADDDTYVML